MRAPRNLDAKMRELVRDYGALEVLAALCRWCRYDGASGLYRRLNRVYEQVTRV